LNEQAFSYLKNVKRDASLGQRNLLEFFDSQLGRVRKKEIVSGTVQNYFRAVKLFCEMNDVAFNWKMLCRGHPKARSFANDRSPTSEELRKLVDYPDRRINA
jgi:hypothetical protein